MKKYLPEKYLLIFHHDIEGSLAHNRTDPSPLPYSPTLELPPPPIPYMDELIGIVSHPSVAPSHIFHFGINGINNLISQMLKKLILTIECQFITKMYDSIGLPRNWVTYMKSQDPTIFAQQHVVHLIVGLSGFGT